jgi:hypothetical protein
MRKFIPITVPCAAFEEEAKRLKIPKTRLKVLMTIVEKAKAELFNQDGTPRLTAEPGKSRKRASAD